MTSYISCTAMSCICESMATPCDVCTCILQCLKSKFLVLCSTMVESASRGGSWMRYKLQILANHKHGRSLATSGCHCMRVIVKYDGV